MSAVEEPSRVGVWRMFDRIAPRYDLLNRTLSLGLDVSWRREVVRHLPERDGLRALDVATGTADLLLLLLDQARIERVLGIDLSEEMLEKGKEKLARHPRAAAAELVRGDALELSSLGEKFDVVTIAFGIRNVLDVDHALREMHAVLSPGGRAMVLEFSTPPPGLFRAVYDVYRAHLLPRIGSLVSGDAEAYRYLDETIRTFPSGEVFLAKMTAAGFEHARAVSMSFGAVTLYIADVPDVAGAAEGEG